MKFFVAFLLSRRAVGLLLFARMPARMNGHVSTWRNG
jgi:hypothetical protein